jgi:hypothetical protein
VRPARSDRPELPCEPALSISMLDDLVVIRPRRRLDRCGTETLVMAVAGATEAGATVLVDLGPGEGERTIRPLGPLGTGMAPCPESHAVVPAAGYVRLGFNGQCWTLDLPGRRFCRSTAPVLPSFVEPAHWTPITSILVTDDHTAVLRTDGTMVSAPVTWNHDERVARPRRPSDRPLAAPVPTPAA